MLVMVIPPHLTSTPERQPSSSAVLFAAEIGFALLHECAAALDIILAVEAGFDHRLEPREVALRLRLADLACGGFGKGDRQRGVLGGELSARVDDFQRLRQPNAFGEAAHALEAVAQT